MEVQLLAFVTSALDEGENKLHAPASLSPGKETWYPSNRSLGGPQSRSGRGGKEKNSQPLPGIEIRSSSP
jgi:hypothetical protein